MQGGRGNLYCLKGVQNKLPRLLLCMVNNSFIRTGDNDRFPAK